MKYPKPRENLEIGRGDYRRIRIRSVTSTLIFEHLPTIECEPALTADSTNLSENLHIHRINHMRRESTCHKCLTQ